VKAAGIDLIWFGVFLVILVEISAITPPVGFNLFVIQGMSGRPLGPIVRGSMPFFFLMLLALFIISVFPELVLFPLNWMAR